jgi:Cys-tRNA(Pro)/Cys-tRNA(Cys) deacylase
MTPAINTAKKAKIQHRVHTYQHNPDAESYGEEAAHILGQDPARVFKTLVIALNDDNKQLAVAIVPVAGQLDLKALAAAAGVKKAAMAQPKDAERATGYVLGGISPLGQRKQLPTFLDESALTFTTIFVSAGKRGLEIELAAADLLGLTAGKTAAIVR